ncbi:hypothetical protein ACFQ61_17550 [Streptomyces sp. NPDC056500]|uniref:hypothetical protein n=1 Tax=Streptomyces sp. NPDC056500 TaxID=3345840 RepID=UPI0036863BCC
MTTAPPPLPPVSATVAAQALDLLPPRLRGRVDRAMGKVAGWPVETTSDGVRVIVDDDTSVTLRTTGGVVAHADDAVCTCLLAPACLHRATLLSSAPLALEPTSEADEDGPAGERAHRTTGTGPDAGPTAVATAHGAHSPRRRTAVAEGAPRSETPEEPEEPNETDGSSLDGAAHDTVPCELTPAQTRAMAALRSAATAVLVSGVSGAGAVHRAGLLHAAHSGHLAGLHLPAAAAVRIARRLDEARSEDPSFRLPELSADLAGLLGLLRRPAEAITPARRSYQPSGPLRLYGLFTEPIVTASGYAGAVTYGLAPDGTLLTISDVAPGDPQRAAQAAQTPVPGGCALPLREWGDGGSVILTGPTVSADGRVGGGSRVRSVRASGARWHQQPLDALWQRPPAQQLAAALDWLEQPADVRPAGGDLLFVAGSIEGRGLRITNGPQVGLLAPDERSALAYADNLRLLRSRPGLALRMIVRVVPDRPGAVQALAAAWTGHDGEQFRADLGLRRLNRSHIPAGSPPAVPAGAGTTDTAAASGPSGDITGVPADRADGEGDIAASPAPTPDPVTAERFGMGGGKVQPSPPAGSPELPIELDLLRRTVDRAVAGGRSITAASADGELPRRLESVGLATGAECVRALLDSAADRQHDALGRLLPADPDGFAAAWLATAVYASAAVRSLLPAAWSPTSDTMAPPASPVGR